MTECNSCGAEANPESERQFCEDCDRVFEAGLKRQKYVAERAEKLEAAKESGDEDTIGRIMTEIVKESVVSE